MEEICTTFSTTPMGIFDFVNSLDPIIGDMEFQLETKFTFITNIINSDKINQNAKDSFNNMFVKRYLSSDKFRRIVDGCYFVFSNDDYLGSYISLDETITQNVDLITFSMYPIQSENNIFNYPDYVLITILLENFSLKDLVDLDTSITNKKFRTRLHGIFSDPSFIIKFPVVYVEWLFLRNIKCEDITMKPNTNYNNSNQYDKSFVTYCINNGSTIKKLDVSKISMFREDSVQMIKSCRNLTHFTFDRLSYHPGGEGWGSLDTMINLKSIYNTCQNLTYISFEPMYVSFEFDDVLLSESCSKLESMVLNIGNLSHFQINEITKILAPCKNLKKLEVQHLRYMTPDLFIYLANNFTKLEDLNIRFSSFWKLDRNRVDNKENEKLANVNIRYLVDNLKNLKNINILHCDWLYYDTLKYIYSNCKQNEYLYLIDKFADVQDEDETNIELIESIVNPLNIKHLIVNGDHYYNEFPVELLFSKIKNVETISSYAFKGGDFITYLTKNCKMVRVLQISGSMGISDDSIFDFADKFKYLTSLSISSIEVTDLSMIQLFKSCKFLETIYISGCEKLTDLSFIEIANLRSLKNLTVNDKITNNCLKTIVLNCYKLESISITKKYASSIKRYEEPFDDKTDVITYEFVLWIVKNAHNLKSFTFCKQNSLTNKDMKKLLIRYGRSYFPTFNIYLINNSRYD